MRDNAEVELELRRAAQLYVEGFPTPPELAPKVMSRIGQTLVSLDKPRPGWTHELALAGLVLLVGAGFAVSIALTRHTQTGNTAPTPIPSSLPNSDLVAAHL